MLSETVADTLSTVNNDLNPGFPHLIPGLYNKEGESVCLSGPIIDKIAIQIQPNDKDHRDAILEGAKHLIADIGGDLFKTKGIYRGKITGKSSAFSLYAPNAAEALEGAWREDSPAHVKIGGMGPKVFGRLEFNPSKWTATQIRHLVWELSRMFLLDPGPGYDIPTWTCFANITFAKVIGQGRVTKIHVAMDLFGYAMDDLAWWNGRPDRTMLVRKGELGTVYLGPFSDKKASKVCIYDKAAETKDAKGTKVEILTIPKNWIRAEARLRNPNIMASCLDQLPNPFLKLHCARPDVAFQAAKYPPLEGRGPHKLALQYAGVPKFLDSIPSLQIRKKMSDALLASKPPIWNSATLWQKWPVMLESFLFPLSTA